MRIVHLAPGRTWTNAFKVFTRDLEEMTNDRHPKFGNTTEQVCRDDEM